MVLVICPSWFDDDLLKIYEEFLLNSFNLCFDVVCSFVVHFRGFSIAFSIL